MSLTAGHKECSKVCEPAVKLIQPTADGRWGSVQFWAILHPSVRLFFHPTNVVKPTDLLHPADVLLLQPKNLFQPIHLILFPVIQYRSLKSL
jgi:hypothetical protein